MQINVGARQGVRLAITDETGSIVRMSRKGFPFSQAHATLRTIDIQAVLSEESMRALFIDNEQLMLEGLEALLQAMLPELSLDKTADLATALQLACSVHYEVILLDWHLLDTNGAKVDGRKVVQALRLAGLATPVVVVSADDEMDWPRVLLELGLSGVVPKCATGSALVDAIQVATRGGIYLSEQTRHQRLQPSYRHSAPARPVDPRERFPDLTARQVDVFKVMIRGLSDKEIGRELGIAETTVKTHVRGILAAVGVSRRGEAVFEVTGGGVCD